MAAIGENINGSYNVSAGKESAIPDQESTAERMLATRFSCTQFLVVNDRFAH